MKKTYFAILLLLMASNAFAFDNQGSDLLRRLHKDATVTDQIFSLGYLEGFIDGLSLSKASVFAKAELTGRISFINLPRDGIDASQIIVPYKIWAAENPKKMNWPADECLYLLLLEKYGFINLEFSK